MGGSSLKPTSANNIAFRPKFDLILEATPHLCKYISSKRSCTSFLNIRTSEKKVDCKIYQVGIERAFLDVEDEKQ